MCPACYWSYTPSHSVLTPSSSLSFLQDAVFFSPHKMVGGPGAPGILVVKRKLLSLATVPTQPGGGTVFFVTKKYGKPLSLRLQFDYLQLLCTCRDGVSVFVYRRIVRHF